jgi:hypothetical protein
MDSNPVAIYCFFIISLPIGSNIAFNLHSIGGGEGEGGAASHGEPQAALHSSTDTAVASGMHCPPKHRYFGSGAGATTHAGANAVAEAVLRCLPAGLAAKFPAGHARQGYCPFGLKDPGKQGVPVPPLIWSWRPLLEQGDSPWLHKFNHGHTLHKLR